MYHTRGIVTSFRRVSVVVIAILPTNFSTIFKTGTNVLTLFYSSGYFKPTQVLYWSEQAVRV